MIKFDVQFKNNLSYPIELNLLFQNLCTQVGLVAGNTDFINSNYMVLGNPFTNNETCREVLSHIAQLAGGFAKIGRDNKVYIISLNKSNVLETIDGNNYFDDFSKNNQWGELNSLVIRLSNVEGENTARTNEESITQNGLTELSIEDNYFLINEVEREKVIEPLWNALKGIKYLPFKTKYYGYPYLDSGDRVKIIDNKDNKYFSYIFNHTFTFNGAYEGNIETQALTKTQTAYKNTQNMKTKFRKVELAVDKINGKITSVIEQEEEQNQKISNVTQTVDEIRSHISEIADLTTSAESFGSLTLERINESEPIRIVVRPVGEDISYLYPSDDLFPSNDLYLPNRKLRFATEGYSVDWEIPDDLLYYDAEHYDELILDYEGQSCSINKRVGFDAEGNKKPLETMKTVDYSYPTIKLIEGDYTITILDYPTAYIFARLMTQNIYTTQFATKAEMNSAITQTKSEIDLNVNKKLTNYSTTVEMNSVINLKVDSITQSVSATYATKTALNNTSKTLTASIELKINKEDLVSELNASADIINIRSNRLIIDSTYFKLTKEGNITATGGKIGGFTLNDTTFSSTINGTYNYNRYDVRNAMCAYLEYISTTSTISSIYEVNGDGEVDVFDTQKILKIINGTETNNKKITGTFQINSQNPKNFISINNGDTLAVSIGVGGINASLVSAENIICGTQIGIGDFTGVAINGNTGMVSAKNFNNTSLESIKKNISKFNNAIEIIRSSDIYEYNFKTEKDTDKKHVGFIIGDKYKTPNIVISPDKKGIENYTMTSILWKAVQEILEKLEEK